MYSGGMEIFLPSQRICCFGGGEGAEILRMDQGNRDAPPAIPHAEHAMGDIWPCDWGRPSRLGWLSR